MSRRAIVAGAGFSLAAACRSGGRQAPQADAHLELPDSSRLPAARAAVARIVSSVRAAVPGDGTPFGLVVRLRARPERLDRVLASYAAQAAAAAANGGNVAYHVNQEPGDPVSLLLYERWRDRAAFESHETSAATSAHFARVAPWLEAERSLTVVVDALRGAPDVTASRRTSTQMAG